MTAAQGIAGDEAAGQRRAWDSNPRNESPRSAVFKFTGGRVPPSGYIPDGPDSCGEARLVLPFRPAWVQSKPQSP